MNEKKQVIVAMSGGVDSSVAVALLKDQGHRVIGVTLRLLGLEAGVGCCGSTRDIEDARAVCATLDVPHYVLDFVADFKASVRDPFVRSYVAGETPNPCIDCNRFIKFDALLKKASALGADFVATGHYARIVRKDGIFHLERAKDRKKDQSYVLHHLGQSELSRLLFPLGDFDKAEAREIARRHQLPVAEKEESMEICFVPDRDAGGYVKAAAPDAPTTVPGPLVDTSGKRLGHHKGVAFYTIGQREGLGSTFGRPVYVVDLDPAANTVMIGNNDEVYSDYFEVRDAIWTAGHPPADEFESEVQIRAHAPTVPCAVTLRPDGSVGVRANARFRAATPGQSAVFYRGDVVVGGGTIRRSAPRNFAKTAVPA